MKQQKMLNTNKGITLIALVITIIVMLILVAVTISMAVNGGLFEYAGKATADTNNAIREEQQLASGKVTIDNQVYNSIDEYLNRNNKTEPEGPSEIVIVESDVVQAGEYDYGNDCCYAYIPSFNVEAGKTYHITYDIGFGINTIDAVASQGGFYYLDLVYYGTYGTPYPQTYTIETFGSSGLVVRYGGNMELSYIKITEIE